MNLDELHNDTSTFLKWDNSSEEKPFIVKLMGDPARSEFRGKPKFDFSVELSGCEGTKTLSCSQLALNALIEAAAAANVSDKVDQVVWSCFKTGDQYDTEYHWSVEGAPGSKKRSFLPPSNPVDDDIPF